MLLEINARFWASLPLCLHAGADFPFHLYQMLVEDGASSRSRIAHGVYCRNWTRDVIWLRENLRAPSGEGVPVGTVLREFAGALAGRESSDTFVLDDPAPGVEDLRRMAAASAAACGAAGAAVWALPPVRRALARGRARVPLAHGASSSSARATSAGARSREGYARTVMNHGVVLRSAGVPAARRARLPGARRRGRARARRRSSAATARRSSTRR